MKIAIVKFPHNSLWGGGEVHTESLIKHLSSSIEFLIITSDELLVEIAKRNHVPHTKVSAPLEPVSIRALMQFPFAAPFFYPKLKKIIREAKKDGLDAIFCLSYTEKILLTKYARKLGLRVFWMEHLQIERAYLKNPLRPLYNKLSKKVTIITVSNGVKKQLIQHGVAEQNIEVIYNGINPARFTKSPQAEKSVTLGTMSRLCEEKAVDIVIKAFVDAKKQIPNLKLKIAGTGPLKKELEQLAGDDAAIEFVGFVENQNAYFKNIDIFLLTSRAKESFGIAAAEAMAAHLPVIATDIAGLNELVVNGETGMMCEIDNVSQVSEAIQVLAKDRIKRERMGDAGRQRIEAQFTEQAMLEKFRKLFLKR